jgi:hypothetical protein
MNKSVHSTTVGIRLPDRTAPSAPFLHSCKIDLKSNVILEWFPNPELDLAGYNVYRTVVNNGAKSEKLNVNIISRSQVFYTDRFSERGILYQYSIAAIDSFGNMSAQSNLLSQRVKNTSQNEIKIYLQEVTYNKKRERIELKWSASGVPDLGLVIYKSAPGVNGDQLIKISGSGDRVIDRDVSQNTIYSYQIRGYTTTGNIYSSEKVSVSTSIN